MGISPRLDYAINSNNTLVARYQYNRQSSDKQGIGDFSLPSKAFDRRNTENSVQVTETAILSPRFINETRFQFMRSDSVSTGDNTIPAINVQGAFNGGGAQIGNSGTLSDRLELSNNSTYTRKTHTIKWGGRLRQVYLDSTSMSNFGGTLQLPGRLGSGTGCQQPAGRGHVDAVDGAGALPPYADFPAGGNERCADPPSGRRRFAIQPERGHAADLGEPVRRRVVLSTTTGGRVPT